MKKICLGMAIFLMSFFHEGKAVEAIRVLEISESGRSLLVDRGSVEKIHEGEKGSFVIPRGDLHNPQLQWFGDAEAIKVRSNESYWYLHRFDRSQALSPGVKLIFVRRDLELSGRQEYSQKLNRVILREGQTPLEYEYEKSQGMSEKIEATPPPSFAGPDAINEKEADIEVSQFDRWFKGNNTAFVNKYMKRVENKYFQKEDGQQILEEEKERKDDALFDSMVTGMVNKYNNLTFGRADLYRKNRPAPDFTIMSAKGTIPNMYEERLDKKYAKKKIDPAILKRLDKEGELWSAPLKDEDLRRYIIQHGLATERRRMKEALETKVGHEFILRFTQSVSENSSEFDENNAGSDYSLGLSYELQLVRTTQKLESWTFELGFERGVSHYDIGRINGKFEKGAFFGALNWYFFNRPYELQKYLWYLGTAFRRGNAKMVSSDVSTTYRYQLVGLPSFRFGLKYRWKAGDEEDGRSRVGLGGNVMLETENLSLRVLDTLRDDIDGRIDIADIKLSAGLSFYF